MGYLRFIAKYVETENAKKKSWKSGIKNDSVIAIIAKESTLSNE